MHNLHLSQDSCHVRHYEKEKNVTLHPFFLDASVSLLRLLSFSSFSALWPVLFFLSGNAFEKESQ